MKRTMVAAVLTLVMAASAADAQSKLDDGQILALFDEVNTTDIWTARLAMAKSQSADVRRLAAMVIADHEAVQHSARELAKKLRVVVAPPAADESAGALAAAVKALQSKPAADFDRAYIAHELAFHQSAIDAVKGTLLPSASHPELKALLKSVLGGFEHHLTQTRALADALGVR